MTRVGEFVESEICGEAQVYLAAHDDNRQWLEPTCGTMLFVSGAGSKSDPLEDNGNTELFASAVPGFIWVQIDGEELRAAFYDADETLEFEHTVLLE